VRGFHASARNRPKVSHCTDRRYPWRPAALPFEVLWRVDAVNFRNEVANERLLVEGCVVGAQEVIPGSKQAVMIHLANIKRSIIEMIS
jgi:hypothetical protein